MHKLDKDSVKMVLVLTVIALISALVLSIVFSLVYKSDEELFKEKVSKMYTQSQPKVVFDVKSYDNMMYTTIKNACTFEDGNTAVVVLSKKAYNSNGLQLFVVFSNTGDIVSVAAYQQSETPGIGSKALDAAHLKKFEGKNATDFAVKYVKDGQTVTKDWELFSIVDSITGATKTSTGVEYAIVGACQYFVAEVYNA